MELPEEVADALRSCRAHFLTAAGFSFFINLLFLAPAIYMLQIYDRVVTTGGLSTLLFVTLALLIALLTLSALDGLRGRLMIRASARLDAVLAPIILRRIFSSTGTQQVQAIRDFDTVRQAIASPVATAVLDAPWTPVFVIVAFLLHFWIGILSIFSIAVLIAIAWRNERASQKAVESATKSLAESHSSAQAAALQSQAVRALGMRDALVARQLEQRSTGLRSLSVAQFSGSRYSAVSRFIRLFVQSASLGLGALLAIDGQISPGGIIAASIVLGRALQPVDSLVGGWATLSAARAAFARLADALKRTPSDERDRTRLPKPRGELNVEQVGVRNQDGGAILLGISFQASPGEILGIIGASGSGKTTLAKVIVGAIAADAGTVRIDGAQRSDWDSDLLGRHIGYLPQDGSLFEGTIADNISRFARWQPGSAGNVDAQVVGAAQRAGVHDLILKLPSGYDTRLGPMGSGLSAGQAQRVALARAFYGEPSLFVLDEPNAALDAEGEAALIRSIDAARRAGATILLIAHRHSVLQTADRLLVLENGRVKMFGPAQDVVARLSSPQGTETAA